MSSLLLRIVFGRSYGPIFIEILLADPEISYRLHVYLSNNYSACNKITSWFLIQMKALLRNKLQTKKLSDPSLGSSPAPIESAICENRSLEELPRGAGSACQMSGQTKTRRMMKYCNRWQMLRYTVHHRTPCRLL